MTAAAWLSKNEKSEIEIMKYNQWRRHQNNEKRRETEKASAHHLITASMAKAWPQPAEQKKRIS
jgi:hypothetical protein